MINYKDDGISHINVYSKGATEIGRYLSNFSDCYVSTEDGVFRTVEGYWYWLACKDDRLRHTSGWESKKLGRELRVDDWPKIENFEQKISKAIVQKMTHQWCVDRLLLTSNLPFYHYYVYGSKTIMVQDGNWMLSVITEFRDQLIRGNA